METGLLLYVELVWTELSKFREHMDRDLGYRHNYSIYTCASSMLKHWFFGDIRGVNVQFGPSTNASGIRIDTISYGETVLTYTMSLPANDEIVLEAFQYRQDRLRVGLVGPIGSDYGKRLNGWLLDRWGDDGILDIKD